MDLRNRQLLERSLLLRLLRRSLLLSLLKRSLLLMKRPFLLLLLVLKRPLLLLSELPIVKGQQLLK